MDSFLLLLLFVYCSLFFLFLFLLAAGAFPSKMFAVPSNCPQPDLTKPSLPLGLSDTFDKNHVATFWMPPLKKYYTYVPGHITTVNRAAATSGALVTVQPGDVRNAGTERDELDLPMLRLGGRELYYSWRFMLNKDFGFSSNRIVLGQVRGELYNYVLLVFFVFFL